MTVSLRHLCRLCLVIFAALLTTSGANAQTTATVDWTTLGAPSSGALPNPSTATASDGSTTATVSYSMSASGAVPPPILSTYVSYYEPTFGNITGSLLLNFDNSSFDPNDKLTTSISLNRAVTGLRFTVTDIDAASWIDAVEVYYDTGDGQWRNAAETDSLFTAGSSATRTRNATVNGWRGTANVAADQTTGNVAFDFGSTLVRGIRIVYFSYTGSGDPGGQAAGVSDLTFNRAFADLSLSKVLLTSAPTTGSVATFRLTLDNSASSSLSATGVIVRDSLPAGFVYSSSTGTGTFNPATGDWNVGTLARGQSASIDISGTVTATNGAILVNRAEVRSSNQFDPDSTPNNNVATEDDYATATLTVGGTRTAGTPPILSCPNQAIIFDWDAVSWTAGSQANSYPLGTIGNISFNLTNDGQWLNFAEYGGLSPTRSSAFSGGRTTAEFSLHQLVNQSSQSGRATTTITLPEIMRGAQFRIFDVDSNPGQFADLVTVEGRYRGTTVSPVLTNGIANYVIGNSAYGDGGSDNNSANGNVVVTFSQPIDTIIIRYGNHSAAPADPGQQGISLHDITFCRPTTTIVADKTSRVLSDGVEFGDIDFNIPGAVVEYCLLATNAGDTRATEIRLADIIPANMSYVAGSIRSGPNCAEAAVSEDDDNSGADESDPNGAHYLAGGEIRAYAATLLPAASVAFTFRATID